MREKIKNLDLRNMPPFERHTRIFQMWNSLKKGESLRIINDHEPKPLYYQFEAEHKGGFEWDYEKKGPKDWIFRIKKLKVDANEENKKKIKVLIKQLHSGADIDKIKEKGKDILKDVSSTDLAIIEQEIIQEGVTRKEMRKLCDVHLEIMKENLEKVDLKLEPGHPIHTLMEEHKMILELIDRLKDTLKKIETAQNYDEVSRELGMLEHIAEHLVEADKHHKREEDVLFPELERLGITEPPEIMMEEHDDLKPKKSKLFKIAIKRNIPYNQFVKKIKELAEYLIKELPNHIYKEDNILYPMAVQTIPKEKWKNIKEKCDKIGYCCFTPTY